MATVVERHKPVPVDIPGRAPKNRRWFAILSILLIAIIILGAVVSHLGNHSHVVTITSLPGTASHIVAGVPVGYTESVEGAVSAATNYDVAIGGKLTLDPTTRASVLNAIVATQSQPKYAKQYADNATTISPALGGSLIGVVFNETPVMWKVDSFSSTHATILIWQVSEVAAPSMSIPRELWGMDQMELVWERGDWKLLSGTSIPNPPSMAGDTTRFPTGTAPLIAALTGFSPYYQVPGK